MQDKIDAYNLEKQRKAEAQAILDEQKSNSSNVARAVILTNDLVAKAVTRSGNKVDSTTAIVGDKIAKAIATETTITLGQLKKLETAIKGISQDIVIPEAEKFPTEIKVSNFPTIEIPKTVTVDNLSDLNKKLELVIQAVNELELKPVFDPKIDVKASDVTVDLSELTKKIEDVTTAVTSIKFPEIPTVDLSSLAEATNAVKKSIEGLRFPVPNYVLPFSDNGKATQVELSNGALPVASATVTERYDIQGDIIYTGQAKPDTLESDAAWTVYKYDLTDMTQASGKVATNMAWDDRTTGDYK